MECLRNPDTVSGLTLGPFKKEEKEKEEGEIRLKY
jgi:hypothetical protein